MLKQVQATVPTNATPHIYEDQFTASVLDTLWENYWSNENRQLVVNCLLRWSIRIGQFWRQVVCGVCGAARLHGGGGEVA